jgi:hypothetical protein
MERDVTASVDSIRSSSGSFVSFFGEQTDRQKTETGKDQARTKVQMERVDKLAVSGWV